MSISADLEPSWPVASRQLAALGNLPWQDMILAVVIDGFSRVVAAGIAGPVGANLSQFAVARYEPNGNLDPSFNGDGKVLTNFVGTVSDAGGAIAIDGFGKTVVAGTALEGGFLIGKGQFAVARYNDDGSLDTTFGANGKVLTILPGGLFARARAIAIDGLNRILVAGFTSPIPLIDPT